METYIIRVNGIEYEVEVEKKGSAPSAAAPAPAAQAAAPKAAPAKKAAAGSGVGDSVVDAHQVHRPAADVGDDDGRLIQQAPLRQHCGIALRIQRHF